MLLLFSLLVLTALAHAQFGQQNVYLCFSFPKSVSISLPKGGGGGWRGEQAEVITNTPQQRGLCTSKGGPVGECY